MIEDLEQEYQKIQKEEKRINEEIKEIESKIKIFSIISWFLVLIGFVVIIVTAPTYHGLKLSEIGDFLGGTVATIWSLASLLFIFVAFLGQQKQMLYQNLELQFSRFELKSTREELKGQKEQMIEQNETMRIQRFETTFFNMLSLFNETVKNVHSQQGYNATGKYSFILFCNKLDTIYLNKDKKDDRLFISTLLKKFFEDLDKHLQEYLKSAFTIISFISNNNITYKETYVKIFKSKLSNNELKIIFYYCLSEISEKEITLFSSDIGLFENIPTNSLLNQEHYSLYLDKLISLKNNIDLK